MYNISDSLGCGAVLALGLNALCDVGQELSRPRILLHLGLQTAVDEVNRS